MIHQKLNVLKDHSEHPLKSPNTHLVAGACTCGAELAPNGFLDTIEQGLDGKPRRTVVWLLADKQIEFKAVEAETISTGEFIKRWNSKKWIADNPDHPIAFQRLLMDNLSALRDSINKQKPTIQVKKGGQTLFLPADCSDADKKKWISKLN